MALLVKEYKELEVMQKKLINDTATPVEINKFLSLINKSGNEEEILNYSQKIGFNSIDKFKEDLIHKNKNKDLINGLAFIGGAILIAWILTRKE